jgi:hypothetical protein
VLDCRQRYGAELVERSRPLPRRALHLHDPVEGCHLSIRSISLMKPPFSVSRAHDRGLRAHPAGSLIVAATRDLAWTLYKRHQYPATTPLRVAC